MHEKWKALSDRGIYGVLECIGQNIGDASQTGKGLASITGSITGMITGGFAGDKLSLKVKKVKVAKAEAKSLKISETKDEGAALVSQLDASGVKYNKKDIVAISSGSIDYIVGANPKSI